MAQIKERLTILMTLAAFNITFLCCRDFGSIPVVYVGANSVRANVVMTAMYNAGCNAIDLCIRWLDYKS